jgi:hypothetical protein
MNHVQVVIPLGCEIEETVQALEKEITITNYGRYNDCIQIDGCLRHPVFSADDEANVIASLVWDVNGECDVQVSIKHMHYQDFRLSVDDGHRYLEDSGE